MANSQTNIQIKMPDGSSSAQMGGGNMATMIPPITAEGVKLVDRLVDPAVYLDRLSVFLYSSHLLKSKTLDPAQPIPGYQLVKIGGTNWHPNMNLKGFTTVSYEIIMALAEDGSTTRFPKQMDLERFCARQTMAIIGMIVSNTEEWGFDNYTIIYPFGLTLWKALVAVLGRSRHEEGKRTFLEMLVHPNLWFTQSPTSQEQPRQKWLDNI